MNNLRKNYIYSVAYQILNILLPLITAPYLSRILGAEKIGVYSYTFSIADYFYIFALLGLNNYGNRTIATSRENKLKLSKTFWSIYLLQVFTSIIVIFIYYIYLWNDINAYNDILKIWSIYILSSILDINWFFFGLEKFKVTVTRNFIIKIISVVLIFTFVKGPEDLLIYASITASSILISNLILWGLIWKHIEMVKVNILDVFEHIKPNLLLFIPIIAISIYTKMDKIMLGYLSSMIQTGFYENAHKVIVIPLSIITALGTVMMPKISNLLSKGDDLNAKKYFLKSIDYTIFISVAMAFGIAGIAPVFTPIFFGEEFIPVRILISLLSITIIFIAWANVIRTQYLIPNRKDKIYITSTIVGAIVNFILNLIFIPKLGAIGAVFGSIAAEFFVALVQTIAVKKEIDMLYCIKEGKIYLAIGVIMFLVIRLIGVIFKPKVITLLLQIIIGIIIYIGSSYLYISKVKKMSVGMYLRS